MTKILQTDKTKFLPSFFCLFVCWTGADIVPWGGGLSQHANATYCSIVGRNMLRTFGYRVSTCRDPLGVDGSNLTIFTTTPNTRTQHAIVISQSENSARARKLAESCYVARLLTILFTKNCGLIKLFETGSKSCFFLTESRRSWELVPRTLEARYWLEGSKQNSVLSKLCWKGSL